MPAEQDRLYAEYALEGLLRADSAARASFYSQMVQNGIFTRDDCRVPENLPRRGGNADVLTGPGREFIAAGAVQSETSARINLRWFEVDEKELYSWRILWDGRIYNIVSVETDLTARREWRLRVEQGVSEGQ